MSERFKPHWQEYSEYFFVNDTIGYPKTIVDSTHYDGDVMSGRAGVNLELCHHVCDLLNELDKSYKRELDVYKRVNDKLQKEISELKETIREMKQNGSLIGVKLELQEISKKIDEQIQEIDDYKMNTMEITFK